MPEPSPEAVEALFQQATELDPAERGAFLDEQLPGTLFSGPPFSSSFASTPRPRASPPSCRPRLPPPAP